MAKNSCLHRVLNRSPYEAVFGPIRSPLEEDDLTDDESIDPVINANVLSDKDAREQILIKASNSDEKTIDSVSTVRLTNNVASQQLVIEASNEDDSSSKMWQPEYSSLHLNESASMKGVEGDKMN